MFIHLKGHIIVKVFLLSYLLLTIMEYMENHIIEP